jgi:hypothetical protein
MSKRERMEEDKARAEESRWSKSSLAKRAAEETASRVGQVVNRVTVVQMPDGSRQMVATAGGDAGASASTAPPKSAAADVADDEPDDEDARAEGAEPPAKRHQR